MNIIERKNNYNYHHKNIKLIEHSIDLLQRNIKDSYIDEYNIGQSSFNDDLKNKKKILCIEDREAYVRLLVGVVVSWSEELLKRLLYEKNGFEDEQIIRIHKLKDARQKWLTIFKVSFCSSFFTYDLNDPLYTKIKNPESESKIKTTTKLRYQEVKSLIENEIFPTIDLRNKVQHGEWLFAFEPPFSLKYDPNLTGLIRKQNIRVIQTKINDITAIYKMIKDIVTYDNKNIFSLNKKSTPFEYFFDINCHRIEHNKENLKYLNEQGFKKKIIDNYVKGQMWKTKKRA
jgi:hypothetical protein